MLFYPVHKYADSIVFSLLDWESVSAMTLKKRKAKGKHIVNTY